MRSLCFRVPRRSSRLATTVKPACTHIAIFAHDLERTIDFYRRYAELIEVHRRTEHKVTVVWMAEEGREHQFVTVLIGVPHTDVVDPAPLAHIGYAVGRRAEVDRLAKMAAREGVLSAPPTDGGKIVGYYCIVADPEGNSVEFSYGQDLGPQPDG